MVDGDACGHSTAGKRKPAINGASTPPAGSSTGVIVTQDQSDDKFASVVFKVKPTFGFETSFSNGGHFRISQERFELREEAVILLSLREVEALYSALRDLVDDTSWWTDCDEGDE